MNLKWDKLGLNDAQWSRLQCMSGSTLKLIAVVTMLIDHTAAFFLFYARPLCNQGVPAFAYAEEIYRIMRGIGRTAFPIFCFLLVEGFYNTSNRLRYLSRLVIFSLISEVPFDLATQGKVIGWKYQNVFFTLALGLCLMMALDAVAQKIRKEYSRQNPDKMLLVMAGIIYILLCVFFAAAAQLIRCDYGGKGLLLILVLYCFRNQRLYACLLGYLSFLWEAWCFPAFLLMPLYNGRRGKSLKYFFYAFYPVHILFLYLLKRAVWG